MKTNQGTPSQTPGLTPSASKIKTSLDRPSPRMLLADLQHPSSPHGFFTLGIPECLRSDWWHRGRFRMATPNLHVLLLVPGMVGMGMVGVGIKQTMP